MPGEIKDAKISWPCPVYATFRAKGGHLDGGYFCPRCGAFFYREKVCKQHMGFVMNVPASCPVLRLEAEQRRNA